ncbi:DUF3164 family protein [Chromobacterium haemolyticum]|uniref:DUF3164 family protein n=1 Tax=Chromobacterium haemolyticum TaxID=394935 RepID=UPI000D3243C1|nr:DUF3164 family protein [Chromobacterium haemolyticum]PTU68804.1 sulfate transporter [Chromobacterium haemolyticum]
MQNTAQDVPEGFLRDAKGRLCPIEIISDLDLARNDFVLETWKRALALQEQVAQFKAELFRDIEDFIKLSSERYQVDAGGEKGNVSFTSFDGSKRVLRAISDSLVFDEGLLAAKALIDECGQRWTEDAGPEAKVLINDAFQTDRAGKISTSRVLNLRRLEIEDETWQRAMKALSNSLTVQCSRAYVRIEQRNPNTGKFESLRFDLAGV